MLSALGIVVRIPIPPEFAGPAAIAGAAVLLAAYLVAARAMIARDRLAGWCWLIGVALLPLFLVALAVAYGEQDANLAASRAPGAGLLGAASLLCLRRAGWYRTATWSARLAALVIAVKLVVRPLVESAAIAADGGLVVVPAGLTHPGSLILGAELVGFAVLGLWRRPATGDGLPRAVASLGASLLAFLALGGCGKKEAPEPTTYSYEVILEGVDIASRPQAELRLGARALGPLDSNRTIELPREVALAGAEPLVAVVQTSCGAREFRLTPEWSPADEARERDVFREDGGTSPIRWKVSSAELGAMRWIRLYLDNLDRPATQLRIGTSVLPVAANSSSAHVLPAGSCADALTLAVDGSPIGVARAAKVEEYDLVDLEGGRCYAIETTRYSNVEDDRPPPPPMRMGGTRGDHIHPVFRVDDVFRQSAAEVTVRVRERDKDTMQLEVRQALNRVPCG